MWYLYTHQLAILQPYRDMFYPAGRKIAPHQALDRLKALGLAVWFMDDGSFQKLRHFVLATDGWPLETQHHLCRWFSSKWSVNPVPQHLKSKGTYRLRFRVDDSLTLLRVMAPYLHPLFREKWHVDEPATFAPSTPRLEQIAAANAKRTALIKAGVLSVGYRTGTIRKPATVDLLPT